MQLDRAIIIVGPSAVGKTTIAKGLEKSGLPIIKVITTTTRQKRPNETEGVDYHFIDDKTFENLIATDGLIEHAKYNEHYYGSRISDVEPIITAGKIPLWVADNQGAEYFKKHYPGTVTIFIMPADFEILRRRLEKRNLPKGEIISRLKIAEAELHNAPKADYRVINYDGKIKFVIDEAASIVRKHFNLPG